MPRMTRGVKWTLIITGSIAFMLLCVRCFIFWHWNAKVNAEIKAFEAEDWPARLSGYVPKTRPDGTKRHFYRTDEFDYSYPSPYRVTTSGSQVAIAKAARDFASWSAFCDVGGNVTGRKAADWNDAWIEPLQRHLTESGVVLNAVKTAAADGTGAFSVDWDNGYQARAGHLYTLIDLADLMRVEAVLKAHALDMQGAFEDVRLMLRLRRLVDDDPRLWSKGVAMRLDTEAFATLNGVLQLVQPDRAAVDAILAELADREKRNDISVVFASETTFGIGFFNAARGDPTVILRYSETRLKDSEIAPHSGGEVLLGQLARFFWIAPADEYQFLVEMKSLRQYAKKPFPRGTPPALAPFPRPSVSLLTSGVTSMYSYGLSREVNAEETADAYVRMARVVLALSLYHADAGAYPPSLDALVPAYLPAVPLDPYDGKALRYKRGSAGYVLYAIGEDRVDNGGVPYRDDIWERNK